MNVKGTLLVVTKGFFFGNSCKKLVRKASLLLLLVSMKKGE